MSELAGKDASSGAISRDDRERLAAALRRATEDSSIDGPAQRELTALVAELCARHGNDPVAAELRGRRGELERLLGAQGEPFDN